MLSDGTVRGFDPRSGKGFIARSNGGRLLPFSTSDMSGETERLPRYLDRITFRVVEDLSGELQAIDLTVVTPVGTVAQSPSEKPSR